MKKVINRYWSQIVLDSHGVALRRGIFRRQCKFLPWNQIEAVGFYVGDISERIKKVAKTYQKEKVRREGKDEEVQQQ